jgi:hypothetical protein
MRFGETASLALGGGRIYYGTVDATPLFVMLVGELSRWGNRREEVDALLPFADRALEWITDYGDKDGDGYVEYQRTTDGLQNQAEGLLGLDAVDGSLPADTLCGGGTGVCLRCAIARRTATERRPSLAHSLPTAARQTAVQRGLLGRHPDGGYFAPGLDRTSG